MTYDPLHILLLIESAAAKIHVPPERAGFGKLAKAINDTSDAFAKHKSISINEVGWMDQRYLDESLWKKAQQLAQNGQMIKLQDTKIDLIAFFIGYESFEDFFANVIAKANNTRDRHANVAEEKGKTTYQRPEGVLAKKQVFKLDKNNGEQNNTLFGEINGGKVIISNKTRKKHKKPKSELIDESNSLEFIGKKPDEVQAIVDGLHRIKPNHSIEADIYNAIGLCYLKLGLHDLALEYFQKALKKHPANATYLFRLTLAEIRSRDLNTLLHQEVKLIESQLDGAIKANTSFSAPYVLKAIIQSEYYRNNGLRPSGSETEYFNKAQQLMLEQKHEGLHTITEILRLLDVVPIANSTLRGRILQLTQMP